MELSRRVHEEGGIGWKLGDYGKEKGSVETCGQRGVVRMGSKIGKSIWKHRTEG